jgi:hypothetical protein
LSYLQSMLHSLKQVILSANTSILMDVQKKVKYNMLESESVKKLGSYVCIQITGSTCNYAHKRKNALILLSIVLEANLVWMIPLH